MTAFTCDCCRFLSVRRVRNREGKMRNEVRIDGVWVDSYRLARHLGVSVKKAGMLLRDGHCLEQHHVRQGIWHPRDDVSGHKVGLLNAWLRGLNATNKPV